MKSIKKILTPISVIALSLALALVGILGIYDCVIPDNLSYFEGDSLPVFMHAQASAIELDGSEGSAEYRLLSLVPIKKVELTALKDKKLIPGGMPFGIKFFTDGLIVTGFCDVEGENGKVNPAKDAGLKPNDLITHVNGEAASGTESLSNAIDASQGAEITLTLLRGENVREMKVTPVKCVTDGKYKTGILIRDSGAGIGTVSFIDKESGMFAGLGISTGGTTSGVTAASAIAAMQEAGSKLSRDNNKAAYRSFRKLCVMVIELIRQFYDMPRCFRIMGENGAARYIQYSNAKIQTSPIINEFGVEVGGRKPLFDIEVTAQKQSPYSKMSQNELALQFYQVGFFNPQMADQAIACLDMMDFDRKQFIMQKIAQNGTLYQQLLQSQRQMLMLAQIVDKHEGSNVAEQIAAGITGGAMPAPIGGDMASNVDETEALGGKEGSAEASTTKKARQRVAESTDPT